MGTYAEEMEHKEETISKSVRQTNKQAEKLRHKLRRDNMDWSTYRYLMEGC